MSWWAVVSIFVVNVLVCVVVRISVGSRLADLPFVSQPDICLLSGRLGSPLLSAGACSTFVGLLSASCLLTVCLLAA